MLFPEEGTLSERLVIASRIQSTDPIFDARLLLEVCQVALNSVHSLPIRNRQTDLLIALLEKACRINLPEAPK